MPLDHFVSSLTSVCDDHGDDHGDDEVDARAAVPVRRRSSGAAHRARLHFPVEQLQRVYHLPLKEAAQELGICEAALKRICRRNHIKKWPFRQLQSVMRRLVEESRLVAMHRAFRDSVAGADHSDETDEFLLPHELENRRRSSAMDAELERQQRDHTLRVEALKREREMIIETAHLAHVPRADDSDDERDPPPMEEPPSSVIMLGVVSVDDPLDLLASLCASEIPRTRGEKYSTTPSRALGHVGTVEILSCAVAEISQEE